MVTLLPGAYHVSHSGEEILLHTLLGSCVAACLYDPIADIIGMNHFLLSSSRYAKDLKYTETEAGRYGVHAMELLINKMLQHGARKNRLRAKAFGGASIMQSTIKDNFLNVGEVNTRFIKNFLATENIPLLASDLNGYQGRVIFFSSQTFSVDVRKIARSNLNQVSDKEYNYWKKTIAQKQARAARNVELWE